MKVSIAKTAFYITLITIISKILGFLREIVVAAIFGASSLTDDFIMAQSIIDVITLILLTALGTTLLPVYSEYHQKNDRDRTHAFLNVIYTVSIVIALGISLIAFFCPAFLVHIFAPSFKISDVTITTNLIRILTPTVLMTLVLTLDTVVLQVNGRFCITAAIWVPANILLIIGMLALKQPFGIYSIAVSTLVGTAAQTLMLWLAKRRLRFPFRPSWNLKEEGVQKIAILTMPILLGSGISQINTFVDRALASGLPEGSIAALAFSNRLSLFVLGLINASIISVFYSSMSRFNSSGEDARFRSLLQNAVNGILIVLIPISFGMIALRLPIVTIIFERGMFDRTASEMTAVSLLYNSIGLVGFALRDVFSRTFYARKDTKTVMINSIFTVAMNISLALLLTPSMGLGGLALANSISGVIGALLLGWRFYRKGGGFGLRHTAMTASKVTVASAVMAVAVYQSFHLFLRWLPSTLLAFLSSAAIGVVLYFLMIKLFHVEEIRQIRRILSFKIDKHKK